MNSMSAAIVTIAARNQARVLAMKRLAMELAPFYQGAIKIELNVSKEKSVKFNLTEYDM